ncbi:hypothetical protein DFS34DRAFT_423424 [Phlyctochytrium arcticum]|nr:hypothetical protein DFS34DRAFT_423424 [Phlyctochytrium arcticum]
MATRAPSTLPDKYLAKAQARRRGAGTHQVKNREFAINIQSAQPTSRENDAQQAPSEAELIPEITEQLKELKITADPLLKCGEVPAVVGRSGTDQRHTLEPSPPRDAQEDAKKALRRVLARADSQEVVASVSTMVVSGESSSKFDPMLAFPSSFVPTFKLPTFESLPFKSETATGPKSADSTNHHSTSKVPKAIQADTPLVNLDHLVPATAFDILDPGPFAGIDESKLGTARLLPPKPRSKKPQKKVVPTPTPAVPSASQKRSNKPVQNATRTRADRSKPAPEVVPAQSEESSSEADTSPSEPEAVPKRIGKAKSLPREDVSMIDEVERLHKRREKKATSLPQTEKPAVQTQRVSEPVVARPLSDDDDDDDSEDDFASPVQEMIDEQDIEMIDEQNVEMIDEQDVEMIDEQDVEVIDEQDVSSEWEAEPEPPSGRARDSLQEAFMDSPESALPQKDRRRTKLMQHETEPIVQSGATRESLNRSRNDRKSAPTQTDVYDTTQDMQQHRKTPTRPLSSDEDVPVRSSKGQLKPKSNQIDNCAKTKKKGTRESKENGSAESVAQAGKNRKSGASVLPSSAPSDQDEFVSYSSPPTVDEKIIEETKRQSQPGQRRRSKKKSSLHQQGELAHEPSPDHPMSEEERAEPSRSAARRQTKESIDQFSPSGTGAPNYPSEDDHTLDPAPQFDTDLPEPNSDDMDMHMEPEPVPHSPVPSQKTPSMRDSSDSEEDIPVPAPRARKTKSRPKTKKQAESRSLQDMDNRQIPEPEQESTVKAKPVASKIKALAQKRAQRAKAQSDGDEDLFAMDENVAPPSPAARTRAACRARGLKPVVKIQWGGSTTAGWRRVSD